MKNNYSNFLLILFSCFSFVSYAQGNLLQDDGQKTIVSYGKTLSDLGDEISTQVTWSITDIDRNEVIASGSGDALTKYVFEKPGMYQVDINENLIHDQNSCNHKHFPEKMLVEVSPLKMDFDFKSVKLSRNIIGGQSVNGTILSVDVRFSSYDNSDSFYTQGFNTAGVRTSVVGKLKNGQKRLQNGINTLEFNLEGQATKNTYIMFDFVDINGNVQSYGFTNKIQ